jgi:hypothetical protein
MIANKISVRLKKGNGKYYKGIQANYLLLEYDILKYLYTKQ